MNPATFSKSSRIGSAPSRARALDSASSDGTATATPRSAHASTPASLRITRGEQPARCLRRPARGQIDKPECPLGDDGGEPRATLLGQRERLRCVPARVLFMAPHGFYRGYVRQMPA